ncbi:MAG: SMC-Scp complex subunit ScpB [Bacteroidetes bacterium]|nr:SMC-Scp complex subunit ScpB [Bacteroidota bacterium]
MNLPTIIESILFVSESPVSSDELWQLLQRMDIGMAAAESPQVTDALQVLAARYEADTYSFELTEVGGGWQLRTKSAYGKYAHHAIVMQENKRLSRAALETLSIIAYRQPVARSEVEHIRGVNCDYAINKLLEKQLIEIAGRADTPGKPLLYKTSPFFMEYFGLKSVEDLPKPKELAADEESVEAFRTPAVEQ